MKLIRQKLEGWGYCVVKIVQTVTDRRMDGRAIAQRAVHAVAR